MLALSHRLSASQFNLYTKSDSITPAIKDRVDLIVLCSGGKGCWSDKHREIWHKCLNVYSLKNLVIVDIFSMLQYHAQNVKLDTCIFHNIGLGTIACAENTLDLSPYYM